MALGCLHAAKEMHILLLTNVLRWPMELFDTTPLGRVINRFSKDVDVVDNTLPQVLRSWIMMLFGVIFFFFFYLKSIKKKKLLDFSLKIGLF